MIKNQNVVWQKKLEAALHALMDCHPIKYSTIKPSDIPKVSGIYMISFINGDDDIPFYIGRSKNLRQRLYNNHLMGPLSNARLKKYLIDVKVCKDKQYAKAFIKDHCVVRWIEADDYRVRGAIESYCTALLFPKYGIDEEH